MALNRKSRRVPAARHAGGTLLGIFIGLILGALVALGVAVYINKMPLPFQDKVGRVGEPRPGEARPASEAGTDGPNQPLVLPGKPGDKPMEKPRFDFYKILPGGVEGAPPTDEAKAPAPAGEAMFLQAGAFQDPADADNLKARLALMGVEASVQQVILADKGSMHRVRIGPFSKPDEMAHVRSQLAQNGIQANVVKAGN